jgi:CheY-like chemotaxis protein/two-component sensor histidine kinase
MLDESGLLTPEVAERLEHSRDATRRIADIVRLLLDTSRERASSATSTVVFEVAPIVDRAVAVTSILAPDLRIEVRLADRLCALGEPSSLEQVLINLVTNSAHATRDVAGGARVRIEGERAGERVLLRVIDNGPGIPASIRERLFEPFATTKPIGEGTGLGLAVSRGLMTRQGGALEVARTSSDGTEMALELAAADASELPAPSAVTSTHALPPPAVAASSIHVLVIEDNEDQRDVLTLQLDRFFHITSAATVEQALAIVQKRSYDVVLCDVMMPRGGAEAWLARCAEIDPKLDERTILLTGGPTTPVAASLVRSRADKVLFKPVDLTVLRPMIQRLAEGDR